MSFSPRDLLFFSGYALYLVFSHMVLTSTTMLSSAGDIAFESQTVFSIALLSSRLTLFLFVICFRRYVKGLPFSITATLSGVFAVAGFLTIGRLLWFPSELPSDVFLSWLVCGGILLGLAAGLVILLWGRFSATLALRDIYLYVVLCNILSLVIYSGVTFLLPERAGLPFAAVLFVVSVVFVKKALDARTDWQWEYSRPVFNHAIRNIGHPILGTAILYFMSGLMLQISGQAEIPLHIFQRTALFSSAVVVLLLFLPALFVKKPLNMGRIYAVALSASAAGFLLLPLFWNEAGGIVNSFGQLGAMVAGIILWCLVADVAHDTKLSPVYLFAITFACTDAADLAGTVIGFLNVDILKPGDLHLPMVALVAVYLLLMVALFLFKDKSFNETEDEAALLVQRAQPDELLAQRCSEIAGTYRLTPREGDVFVLLAQGFTVPVISDKLFVSENTVKSHVKSIYQKLSVRARSDLIELVNAK
ncbi:MAG: helix-turn-helix transcriptional regulator [Eggerthellaceae bacterium]|nr:helix-turn-helix transcriptional regulator [Eggerthellaceae bacterium]